MADISIKVEHDGRTRWRSQPASLNCKLVLPAAAQQQTDLLTFLRLLPDAQELVQWFDAQDVDPHLHITFEDDAADWLALAWDSLGAVTYYVDLMASVPPPSPKPTNLVLASEFVTESEVLHYTQTIAHEAPLWELDDGRLSAALLQKLSQAQANVTTMLAEITNQGIKINHHEHLAYSELGRYLNNSTVVLWSPKADPGLLLQASFELVNAGVPAVVTGSFEWPRAAWVHGLLLRFLGEGMSLQRAVVIAGGLCPVELHAMLGTSDRQSYQLVSTTLTPQQEGALLIQAGLATQGSSRQHKVKQVAGTTMLAGLIAGAFLTLLPLSGASASAAAWIGGIGSNVLASKLEGVADKWRSSGNQAEIEAEVIQIFQSHQADVANLFVELNGIKHTLHGLNAEQEFQTDVILEIDERTSGISSTINVLTTMVNELKTELTSYQAQFPKLADQLIVQTKDALESIKRIDPAQQAQLNALTTQVSVLVQRPTAGRDYYAGDVDQSSHITNNIGNDLRGATFHGDLVQGNKHETHNHVQGKQFNFNNSTIGKVVTAETYNEYHTPNQQQQRYCLAVSAPVTAQFGGQILVKVELRPASEQVPGMSDVFTLGANERVDLVLSNPQNLDYPDRGRTISIDKRTSEIVFHPARSGPASVTLRASINGNVRYSKELSWQVE